jgi:hypothetical protein
MTAYILQNSWLVATLWATANVVGLVLALSLKRPARLQLASFGILGAFALCAVCLAGAPSAEPDLLSRGIFYALALGGVGIVCEVLHRLFVPASAYIGNLDSVEALSTLKRDVGRELNRMGRELTDVAELLAKNQKKIMENIRSALGD